MKRTLLILIIVGLTSALRAATIAQWTFESSIPSSGTNTQTSLSGIAPEVGSGSASGVHASAAAWSSPSGNGSAHSFSVNTWAVGDYFQFQVSTLGFSGIGLSYDQISSSTGPGRFDLSYSLDGSSFTSLTSGAGYSVIVNTSPNTWSSSTPQTSSSYFYDLSGVSALDNAATAYFRLTDISTTSAGGATVASGGTDRIDNFAVFSPVPEPSALTMIVLAAVGCLGFLKRKQ